MKKMKVVEMNDWEILPLKYGPNTAEVQALIDKLRTLTVDQARQLDAAWDSAWSDVWSDAWNSVWKAARTAAWYAARDVAWDAAREAAWDAILALLVKDLITPEQFDLLYGPWKQVMEEQR